MGLFSGIKKIVKSVTGGLGDLGLGITGGDLLSGGLGLLGGMSANSANAEQAQYNRDFQANMSSTSYQRAVADMRAAGLNPMLAYQQGGASTPSGAQATANDVITPALSSARQNKRVNAEVDNMVRQNRLIHANTMTAQSQTELNYANREKTMVDAKKSLADTAQSIASARKLQSETRLTDAALTGALNDAAAEKALGADNSSAAKLLKTINLLRK